MTVVLSIIFVAVFLTSLLSGVLGMAGGMILMAVLSLFLSVQAAMILHGVVQGFANGYRSWIHRSFIQWKVLPAYLIGVFLAVGLMWIFHIQPTKRVVFLFLGLIPFVTFIPLRTKWLEIENSRAAVLCGFLVQMAQLLGGASGALLDIFYQQSRFNRFEIIATKAFTQCLGHLFKIFFYLQIFVASSERLPFPLWVFPLSLLLSGLGTEMGKKVLERMDETGFRSYSRWTILVIGIVCLLKAFKG